MSSSTATENVGLMTWTVEDYHDLIDKWYLDDRDIKLINGQVLKNVPQSPWHAHKTNLIYDTLLEAL